MTRMPALLISILMLAALGHCGQKRSSVRDLRITTQMAPWREEAKSFVPFNGSKLYDLIDGGASEHVERGLKEGIFQRLTGPDSMVLEVYAEDFAVPESAQALALLKLPEPRERIALKGADSLFSGAAKVMGGFTAVAVIDHFFFEMLLMGTADEKRALLEMEKAIAFYRKKIQPSNM